MEFLTDIEKRLLFSAIGKERKVCVEIDKEGSPDSIALTPVVDSLSNKFMYDRLFKKIYEQGRADQKHEDLDAQVILTKNEIRVLETSLVKKILTAIKSEYDLNYGETLLNPIDFYNLVERFYPTITPPTKDRYDKFEEEKRLEADYDIDDCYEERE